MLRMFLVVSFVGFVAVGIGLSACARAPLDQAAKTWRRVGFVPARAAKPPQPVNVNEAKPTSTAHAPHTYSKAAVRTAPIAPRPRAAVRRSTSNDPKLRPYAIAGQWYYPRHDPAYNAVGMASWYGGDLHGKPTANGETFDKDAMTAAHPTLAMHSWVEVTNLNNGRKAIVRINDRGPFAKNRLIDVSQAAARKLGFETVGVARVRVRYLHRTAPGATRPRPGSTKEAQAQPKPPVRRRPWRPAWGLTKASTAHRTAAQ